MREYGGGGGGMGGGGQRGSDDNTGHAGITAKVVQQQKWGYYKFSLGLNVNEILLHVMIE